MAKKRGKSKYRAISKKSKAPKKKVKKYSGFARPLSHTGILHDLNLAEEKKIEEKINGVEKKEAEIITEEERIEKETEKVEKLEKDIKKEVTAKPLTKFSMKDLNKGIIGAFIGVVAHFAFIYGKEIAKDISTARATILIIFSYLLIIILMYETGYREIKEKRLLGILPKRATAIYLTSVVIILIIFLLFNQINLSDITGTYKQIAVTLILASLGAGTADLIGRD
ncbi:DUF2391 family protein [Candidatus Woesearchaeota archaeon]|nr:DUF2391 family protein [Candidatus Woesearchaeota archaeon]